MRGLPERLQVRCIFGHPLAAQVHAGLAREGYQKNAVAYRCVRMIAEGAASVPLRVFADGTLAADHRRPVAWSVDAGGAALSF